MISKNEPVPETTLADDLVAVPDILEAIKGDIGCLLAQLPHGSDNRLLANGISALYGAATALTMAQYTLTEFIEMECSSGTGKESGNA